VTSGNEKKADKQNVIVDIKIARMNISFNQKVM